MIYFVVILCKNPSLYIINNKICVIISVNRFCGCSVFVPASDPELSAAVDEGTAAGTPLLQGCYHRLQYQHCK